MKITRCLTLTLLIFISLFIPDSFAQPDDYMVRLVYFLPKDRTPQPDIDTKIEALMKEVQQLFADEMERHGYGRKTFALETDVNGKPVVHHIQSPDDDKYFHETVGGDPSRTLQNYFGDDYDFQKYIFLVFLDVSTEVLGADWAGYCGLFSSVAWVPASGACFQVKVVAHEIGHGFGLRHNFYDDAYIMSYGSGADTLSACAAEWLDVSPYFNRDKVRTPNQNTRIELISHTFDTTPPYTQRLRFEISDPDGLHQAQLITRDDAIDFSSYVDCQSLRGTHAIVEFATTQDLRVAREGSEPSTQDMVDVATIYVTDKYGNYLQEGFEIEPSTRPGDEVAVIPDANLATALRDALGYTPEEQITLYDMTRLKILRAGARGITDLTGLEHAVGLRELHLRDNQIHDITPLTGLVSLQSLHLGENQIVDISPLESCTELEVLVIYNNRIKDISALSTLTHLTYLGIGDNQVSDISPLSTLTHLTYLGIGNNQVSDISALSTLTHLVSLGIGDNQVSDISPLSTLTHLEHLTIDDNLVTDISVLSHLVKLTSLRVFQNQITDISVLSHLVKLTSLQIFQNPIIDISALSGLTHLEHLVIFYCQVTDISPIIGLTALKSLSFYHNQISDISRISNLRRLQELDLSHNKISDVSPLADMVNLRIVRVIGNPLKSKKPLLALLRKNPDVEIWVKAGGEPLPVTLSRFKAERIAQGAVINWTTESEVDNAGFNILRSRTQTGEFRQVNVKLIQGAGTTGQRTEYTWTDTTAKPNTVYYYQIEDVSHAGVRELLATVRLRGLVSAKGKLMNKWADLKATDY